MKTYDRLIKENVAPEGAKKIGVWNGSKYGTIPLSGLTRPNLGSKLYSFAAVSDVHKSVANSNLDKSDVYDMTGDLDRALTFVKGKVNFICGCGDLTLGGFETELSRLKTAINNKSFTVGRSSDSETTIVDNHFYSCSGNHEIYGRDWTTKGYNMNRWNLETEPKALQEYWKTYMGMDKHTLLTRGNDVFIFCSPDNATAYNSSVRNYSNADIEWLYNVLRTNRNKRCFVFTHFFFPAMSGDYGGKNAYYSAPMDVETERQFTLLLKKYRNVVWFSGHSHFVWESQGRADNKGNRNYDANIAKTADSGYCVHLPSLGQPRVPTETISGNAPDYDDETKTSDTTKKKWLLPLPTSQFAIVDVYSNYIVIKGLSYISGAYQYLPIAQYCLNTTLVNVDDATIDFNGGGQQPTDEVYFYYISNTARTADGWLERNGTKVTSPQTGVQYTVRFMRYSNGDSAEMLYGNATDYSFRLISSYNQNDDSYVSIRTLDHSFDSSGRMLVTIPASGLYRIKCLWHRDSDGAEISSVLIINI